ncbi:MAG: hypothetical protein Q4F91_10440, partial [Sutterella sp.]|nr:hypothetical protein [Sutterella sp.]
MTGTILSKGTVVVTEGNVRRPRVTFTHPDGEEWDGHGEMPDWVREALDEKWLLERYEVSEAEDDEEESFGWGDTTPFDDDADEDDWED